MKAAGAYRTEHWREESKGKRETAEVQRGPLGVSDIQKVPKAGERST